MRNTVSSTERTEIVAALNAKESQNSVAKQFDRSPSTINRIAQAEGLEYSAPKKANQARRDFSLARQLELSNTWFIELEKKLMEATKAKDIRDISVSLGICFDKRLLLDGKATSRSEITGSNEGSAIAKLKSLLHIDDENDDDSDSNG